MRTSSRYRNGKDKPTFFKSKISLFGFLLVGSFFLILALDCLITKYGLNSDKSSNDMDILTSRTSVNIIPKTGTFEIPENLRHLPPDSPQIVSILPNTQKSQRLQELFLYKFNQLLSKRLNVNSEPRKTPSDYDTANLMSTVYDEYGESINFIQVGACDGDFSHSNDPIQKLLRKTHWHGVMMEPVPFLFDKLKVNIQQLPEYSKRIHLLNAALSNVNGEENFHIVSDKFAEEKPDETHALKYQISSFDPNHIRKHLIKLKRRGELKLEVDDYIEIIKVKSMKPDTVVNDFFSSSFAVRDGTIDILLIDAEGYDLEVLKSFMRIEGLRPPIIIYETLHFQNNQKQEAKALLQSFGYAIFDAGWNAFGVRVAKFY